MRMRISRMSRKRTSIMSTMRMRRMRRMRMMRRTGFKYSNTKGLGRPLSMARLKWLVRRLVNGMKHPLLRRLFLSGIAIVSGTTRVV